MSIYYIVDSVRCAIITQHSFYIKIASFIGLFQ